LQQGTQEALADNPESRGYNQDWHTADIICGGFPCQDISNAGKRAGLAGSRSGLWAWLCGAIRMVRPKYAIVENVAALLGNGMGVVLGDLAEVGYDTEWHCIPASHVGAEHERDRIWIIAYPDIKWELQQEGSKQEQRGWIDNRPQKNVTDTDSTRLERRSETGENGKDVGNIAPRLRFTECPSHLVSRHYWKHQPLLGRGLHGIPDRVDRIESLGNTVIPHIPELIGKAILEYESK